MKERPDALVFGQFDRQSLLGLLDVPFLMMPGQMDARNVRMAEKINLAGKIGWLSV